MKFSSLISWACTSLEKIKWITRAPVTASEREEQRSISPMSASERVEQRSRAPMAASERKEQRSRAAASYSEYREIISTSKEPMEHKPWEPKNRSNPEKEFEWMNMLPNTIEELDNSDFYSKYLEQIQASQFLNYDSELMKMMQNTIEELAKSDFYSKFLQQMQTPQFLNHFSRVLGSESQFQVVIYGQFCFFGSYNVSAPIKLALILLLKRDFNDRIGEIQIFDPVFSKTEVRVLEDLGFSVLPVNENAYREVLKPTLFFMPSHASLEVYDHVLRANWKPENLNRMIILGDDLNGTKDHAVWLNGFRANNFQVNGKYVQMCRYLMCIPRFSTVVPISSIDGGKISQKLSQRLSWHFFTWFDDDPKMKLLLKQVVVITGILYYLFYRYRKCKLITEGEEEDSSWQPNYSKEFRLGWLFRRQRIRSDKQRLLGEKNNNNKKKRMLFYMSRAIVLPWFEGLPRKKWAEARELSQGVMTWMKENDDEISYRQLDILIEAWF